MLTFVVVSVSLYSSIGATILMMEIISSQKGQAKLCLDGYIHVYTKKATSTLRIFLWKGWVAMMSGLLSIGLLSEWPSVRWPFIRLVFCPGALSHGAVTRIQERIA